MSKEDSERPNYGADVLAIALTDAVGESRRKTQFMWGLLVCLGLSILGNVFQFQYLPATKVVSETADGRIRPLPTIDEPIFTDQQVMNWAATKIETLYDINFTEVSEYPGKIRTFMLPKAADDFVAGLRSAGIIDKVISERLILRGVRSAPPTITSSFLDNGRFIWVIEMPMTAIYEGSGGNTNKSMEPLAVRVYVGREHLMRSEDGLVFGSVNIFPGR